jgi:hypothetical protein
MQSSFSERAKVPDGKSLFEVPVNCGLPIGNLTSQFFANVYMNALDQYVKHVLKCRFYVRYVDDFILLSESTTELQNWLEAIELFLFNDLELSINQQATKIDRISNGVDFVGFIIRPFYTLCRRRVIGNCKRALKKYRDLLVIDEENATGYKYDYTCLDKLLSTMNSYLGHFKHAKTRKVVLNIIRQYPFVKEYFIFEMDKLIRKFKYKKQFRNLRQQVKHFSMIFADYLVIFQIGCYYEAFNQSAQKLCGCTGYKLRKKWRGFNTACGFHQRFLTKVQNRLYESKIDYVIIKQTGNYLYSVMERVPEYRICFNSEFNV